MEQKSETDSAVLHQEKVKEDPRPSTILLIDDEKLARMVTRRRLERLGHRILEAENGRQALEVMQREQLDLVISDWMMPEMDGPSFCEAVKGND